MREETMPRILPAVLDGRRVDFFPARIWARFCPGWRPGSGYWRVPGSGDLIAALEFPQAEAAVGLLRLRGQKWTLPFEETFAAESGEVLGWTLDLAPVPPDAAEREILGCGGGSGKNSEYGAPAGRGRQSR